MVIDKFEDINAWQEARILTQRVYEITRTKPFNRDIGLSRKSVMMIDPLDETFYI